MLELPQPSKWNKQQSSLNYSAAIYQQHYYRNLQVLGHFLSEVLDLIIIIMQNKRLDKNQLEDRIYEILGYSTIDDNNASYEGSLERTRQQIGGNKIQKQLDHLTSKSQRKKRKLNQQINSKLSKNLQVSDELKQLEWRLEILRADRKQREKDQTNLTFQQLYNRQKNKYARIRERNKIKMNDEKYLDMLGSTIMRRQKRKIDALTKLEKHIEMLDEDIRVTTKEHNTKRKNR